jgi:hypothetical protein
MPDNQSRNPLKKFKRWVNRITSEPKSNDQEYEPNSPQYETDPNHPYNQPYTTSKEPYGKLFELPDIGEDDEMEMDQVKL